jgi:glucoamylase
MALALADDWNAHIEAWTVNRGGVLAERHGVSAYYVRVAPAAALMNEEAMEEHLPIKNRRQEPGLSAAEQVGTDFLQLVRFGLHRADDPLILDTLAMVDALLKVDTPNGPAWYRYNGDGYGEHEDGRAFDGSGRGRAWPLLAGERGHYELAAGKDPLALLEAMARMCGEGGMLPEQVWDAQAIPERWLYPGRPTGSAMPLAWAHSEFIKLAASRELGAPFDRPAAVWERYQGVRPQTRFRHWLEQAPIGRITAGQCLRVCLASQATIHWRSADGEAFRELPTREAGLGLQVAELPTTGLPGGSEIEFHYDADATRHKVIVRE